MSWSSFIPPVSDFGAWVPDAERLARYGIATIGDLARVDPRTSPGSSAARPERSSTSLRGPGTTAGRHRPAG